MGTFKLSLEVECPPSQQLKVMESLLKRVTHCRVRDAVVRVKSVEWELDPRLVTESTTQLCTSDTAQTQSDIRATDVESDGDCGYSSMEESQDLSTDVVSSVPAVKLPVVKKPKLGVKRRRSADSTKKRPVFGGKSLFEK